jgi:hypothetical protein
MLTRAAIVLTLWFLLPGFAAAQFFPPRIFSEKPDLHEFTVAWYSKHLSAMDEPSLWKQVADKGAESYRFTWLRTFHPPFAFRVQVRADETGALIVKSTSGAGGYDPGHLVLKKAIPLSAAQVRRFISTLRDLRFWDLPTTDPSGAGLDGAQWVLEGVKDGRYHVVDRWTPEGGSFRGAMLDLVALGGVQVEPIY